MVHGAESPIGPPCLLSPPPHMAWICLRPHTPSIDLHHSPP